MQINIKGKNVDVTDALKVYCEKRIGKMEKFFDHIISTDITLSLEKNWHVVEVTVYANGFVLRGEERTDDMYASIDKVIDKLEKQLKKHKEKSSNKKHAGETIRTEAEIREALPAMAELKESDDAVFDPKIVTVKRFATKPMTVSQAVKEMEALGYNFYVFYNGESKAVNVVYKQKTGYGLIEPVV